MDPQRRRFLAASLGLSLAGLTACSRPQPPVRVAGIVWVGYEPLFLARELGLYDAVPLRLVEAPSSTASLMALATGNVEAATLTLDEYLIARDGGLDVRAILVFDDSAGADVVMARPGIRALVDLRNKRIGVEETAAGALMLAKLLQAAGLAPADIVKMPLTGGRQVAAYREGEVDALVSYEPYATQLAHLGARRILDSRRFPGLIVDVLVAQTAALETAPELFRRLVGGYFRALDHMQRDPQDAAARMAPRMGIRPEEVLEALKGVRMMDRAANRAWLEGPAPRLLPAAATVAHLMHQSGLLRGTARFDNLADPRFLPPDGGAAA